MNQSTVYVLSGYAKCADASNGKYKLGNKHSIGLLTTDKNYEENLDNLKAFVRDLGWDAITFCLVEQVEDISALEHEVLISSFKRAHKNGQSLVVNDQPITVH